MQQFTTSLQVVEVSVESISEVNNYEIVDIL